jgi:hypothetical protein
MRYEQGRAAPRQPQILVAAAPGDPRALRLVDDLQAMGWNIFLAETPEIAEEIAPRAICVVVLRPRYWNAPPIAATVRANPPYLIPVLAEPMPLPRGPWTFEPIPMESPRQVATEVAQALEDGLRALDWRRSSRPNPVVPRDTYPSAGPSSMPYRPDYDPFAPAAGSGNLAERAFPTPSRPAARAGVPLTLQPVPAKRRAGAGRVVGPVLSVLVIAGLLFGGYKAGVLNKVKGLLSKGTAATSTATQPIAYSAALPGPGCDKGGGTWEPVHDSSLTLACQTGGTLVTKNSNFDTVGTIYFAGKDLAPFPASYRVQLTASIQSGDASTGVGLEVHGQAHSGGQVLDVQSSGWVLDDYGTDGHLTQRLALGFFPQPVKTFVMVVDVEGGAMTLTINNVVVDTVLNATYDATETIGLIIEDGGATKPIVALFSQFSYTPLTAPGVNATAIAATATAVAMSAKPYQAAIPGPGCDKGKGQWDPTTFGDPTTTIKCLSDGLQITQPGTAQNVGEVNFYNLDGNFPANYTLAAQVTMNTIAGGCVGFFARSSAAGSYHVYVCGDGAWRICKRMGAAPCSNLDAGNIAINTNTPAQLDLMVSGSTLTFTINGVKVSAAKDPATPLTATDDISLALDASSNTAVAVFRNFVFTPLP